MHDGRELATSSRSASGFVAPSLCVCASPVDVHTHYVDPHLNRDISVCVSRQAPTRKRTHAYTLLAPFLPSTLQMKTHTYLFTDDVYGFDGEVGCRTMLEYGMVTNVDEAVELGRTLHRYGLLDCKCREGAFRNGKGAFSFPDPGRPGGVCCVCHASFCAPVRLGSVCFGLWVREGCARLCCKYISFVP